MDKIYRVTTGGSKKLGLWKGDVADIALHLADKVNTLLFFEEVTVNISGEPTGEKVEISSMGLKDELQNKLLNNQNLNYTIIIEDNTINSYSITLKDHIVKEMKLKKLLKEKERIEKELKDLIQ